MEAGVPIVEKEKVCLSRKVFFLSQDCQAVTGQLT